MRHIIPYDYLSLNGERISDAIIITDLAELRRVLSRLEQILLDEAPGDLLPPAEPVRPARAPWDALGTPVQTPKYSLLDARFGSKPHPLYPPRPRSVQDVESEAVTQEHPGLCAPTPDAEARPDASPAGGGGQLGQSGRVRCKCPSCGREVAARYDHRQVVNSLGFYLCSK